MQMATKECYSLLSDAQATSCVFYVAKVASTKVFGLKSTKIDQWNTLWAHVGVYVVHTMKLSVDVKLIVDRNRCGRFLARLIGSIMLCLLSSIEAFVCGCGRECPL
jgi:hypothetical protein